MTESPGRARTRSSFSSGWGFDREIITMRIGFITLCVTLLLIVAGCSHNNPAPSTPNDARASAAGSGEPGGAELWAGNCARCHNIRPPQSFSSTQWETIVHHMRLRANLTGEEARQITEFLQASN
jgi:hypothetical protein